MAKAKRKPQKPKSKSKRGHGKPRRKSTNEMMQAIIQQSISGNRPHIPLSTGSLPIDRDMMIQEYRINLVRQYHAAMKDKPKGDSNIDRLDVVDLTKAAIIKQKDSNYAGIGVHALTFDDITNRRIADYQAANEWLTVLPCLPEGLLVLGDMRTYFAFERLSLEDRQIDLHVATWSRFDKDIYMCHDDIYVTLDFNVPHWYLPLMLFSDKSRDAVQIYGNVATQYACKWNTTDRANWADFIELAKNMKASLKSGYDNSSPRAETDHPEMYYEVSKFIAQMSIANALMATSNQRPQTSHVKRTVTDTAIAMGVDAAPDTIVQVFDTGLTVRARHMVDPIRKAPVLVNYTQDKWTVRGHTRTYKDGHTIYVKPHTRTRHGMPEENQASQPRKIREITARGDSNE